MSSLAVPVVSQRPRRPKDPARAQRRIRSPSSDLLMVANGNASGLDRRPGARRGFGQDASLRRGTRRVRRDFVARRARAGPCAGASRRPPRWGRLAARGSQRTRSQAGARADPGRQREQRRAQHRRAARARRRRPARRRTPRRPDRRDRGPRRRPPLPRGRGRQRRRSCPRALGYRGTNLSMSATRSGSVAPSHGSGR